MLLWSIYGDISLNYYKTILIILRAVLESKAGQQNTFKTNAKFEMSEGIDNQVYQIDCVYMAFLKTEDQVLKLRPGKWKSFALIGKTAISGF